MLGHRHIGLRSLIGITCHWLEDCKVHSFSLSKVRKMAQWVLASQTWGPDFGPPVPTQKLSMVVCVYIHSARRQRQADPRAGELQVWRDRAS